MSETVFKQVQYDLGGLIKFIELGEIGLPDIQRPFVWKNIKVRDLFDSMYHGYPVGYLLFWQNGLDDHVRNIGVEQKQKPAKLLIVDGQQRLTSLYAVLKGIPVKREDYSEQSIELAFNPLEEKFEVTDAAIRRDKSYIPNISNLWTGAANLFKITNEYLDGLKTARDVSSDEETQVQNAIMRLHDLMSFPFTALELSANINEEQVAEVFVRINSKGKSLNQADFILTLMSVFWDEGRDQLERFCRDARLPSTGKPSPFNHFIHPGPDQLLRVSVGLGFKRARLQYVYSLLRGKDLETEVFSEERRISQFEVLKEAQARVLDLQHWHDFMKLLVQAGYRNGRMISSETNLLFLYTLYLIGRTEYKVDEFELRRALARWFFVSSLTGRYTGSPESMMEFDLARFRTVKDADTFVNVLDRVCDETLTTDFWSITLPNELATSSPRSPSLFAYYASLSLLDATAFFSKQKISDLLDPTAKANRTALERHHLFPKAYLQKKGVVDQRETNQIANYAATEWGDNATIGEKAPVDYLPDLETRFTKEQCVDMYYWHALPDGWQNMDYSEFLAKRRDLIAKVVADAYATLSKKAPVDNQKLDEISLESLILGGETPGVEFKSTLRINLHTKEKDPRIELGCLKTVAAFLNGAGGTLIVGVADDGTAVGMDADQFPNEDKMSLHLVNLLNDRVGPQYSMYIHPRFEDYKNKRVLVVECQRAKSPVFVKDGKAEHFFVRTGPSTKDLTGYQMQEYIRQHFH